MSQSPRAALPPPYKSPVLLTARDHGALAYRKPDSYAFARSINSVPVVMNEIPKLLPHYPIAFTTGPNPVLIALLGARNDENLFVGPNGEWTPGAYIPAYLRRYPFILMEMPDKVLALSAEMDPEFLGAEGERLFADGAVITTRAKALYDGIGADLPGLICGSEGTLGIITRIWCRLVPRPRHFRTVYGVYASTHDACTTGAVATLTYNVDDIFD